MTRESPAGTVQQQREADSQGSAASSPGASSNDGAVWVEPDLDFIRALNRQGGDSLKKCFQCGTCSATCNLSPDTDPFPRKEMAWAAWGMKDRLLRDPDVWLCYHCNDCSTICPRGGGPGDVLAAVREECVKHYAVPQFLSRWVGQPQAVPFLLGIPAALLALALFVVNQLGITKEVELGKDIIYPYSSMLPHWLLNSFFGVFSLLALLSVAVGVRRFWRAMKDGAGQAATAPPAKSLSASILTVLKNVFTHDKFATCEKERSRFWSHTFVFYGFLALSLVSFWVVTAKVNPLIQGEFIYPFNFFSPWKMLANIGGLAVLGGCGLMIWDRLKDGEAGSGSYFDWALIATLVIVVLTGFIAETLHIIHLEPHRHIAYFVHLVFVFSLLIYVPYSKLAHIFYRTAALVFAEYSGRDSGPQAAVAGDETNAEDEENDHAGQDSQ
jgi:quinone-modifying oxidoreductase subunit QmoC